MGVDMPMNYFDINSGWLYGTFKFKTQYVHRFQADINGQLFEYPMISCDADNNLYMKM